MIIGIDMDAVIVNLQEPLQRYSTDKFGTNLTPEDITDYDLSIFWKCTKEEMINRILDFYQSPYMLQAKPINGSVQAITQLAKNHELVVITSRPHSIDNISNDWIDTYFKDKFTQVIHSNQFLGKESKLKSEICKDVGATLIIEDHLDYAYDCALNDIKVLLFNQPWNQTNKLPKNVKRVQNWQEIVSLI